MPFATPQRIALLFGVMLCCASMDGAGEPEQAAAQTLSETASPQVVRERISINRDWRFMQYDSAAEADSLIYDVMPEVEDAEDARPADAEPTEAVEIEAHQMVLKPWILPTGNDFIKDPAKRHVRPDGNPGMDFPLIQDEFDDSNWETADLPHDWAIGEPFM